SLVARQRQIAGDIATNIYRDTRRHIPRNAGAEIVDPSPNGKAVRAIPIVSRGVRIGTEVYYGVTNSLVSSTVDKTASYCSCITRLRWSELTIAHQPCAVDTGLGKGKRRAIGHSDQPCHGRSVAESRT